NNPAIAGIQQSPRSGTHPPGRHRADALAPVPPKPPPPEPKATKHIACASPYRAPAFCATWITRRRLKQEHTARATKSSATGSAGRHGKAFRIAAGARNLHHARINRLD